MDIPDLSGKTIVITGANSGLGYEASLALAGRGAHVVLACRDQKKGADAERQIKAAHPRVRGEPAHVDLELLGVDARRVGCRAQRDRGARPGGTAGRQITGAQQWAS